MLGLYKGLPTSAAAICPTVIAGFFGKSIGDFLVGNFCPEIKQEHKQFTAGCLGGATGCLVKVPAELLKNRCQIERREFVSMRKALVKVIRNEGFSALYKGKAD